MATIPELISFLEAHLARYPSSASRQVLVRSVPNGQPVQLTEAEETSATYDRLQQGPISPVTEDVLVLQ